MPSKITSSRESSFLVTARAQYLKALIRGDSKSINQILCDCISNGIEVTALYLQLIAPSQSKLGDLWVKGKISLTQEHIATQISMDQMRSLREKFPPKKTRPLKALICTAPTETHELGARMVADFFYFDGWEVFFPGKLTPTAELVKFTQERSIQLVGISVCLYEALPSLIELIEELAKLSPRPQIIVGGPASSSVPAGLAIDEIANSPSIAVERGLELCCGTTETKNSLAAYLQFLGDRISSFRGAQGLTQGQLAERCKVDRAYLSALENGRKNVSLGTLDKIATVLGVELGQLLK